MPIADLARTLKVGAVLVYKMEGYSDESGDDSTPHFALAGLFAPSHHWGLFEGAWESLVAEYDGLDEFHTEHCVNRTGYWKSWENPADRDAVLQRFVRLLSDSPYPSPIGFVTLIDLEPFQKSTRIKEKNPWIFAYCDMVSRMIAAQVISNDVLSGDERMGFVFDIKDGVKGRALAIAEALGSSPTFPRGAVSFDDSRNHAALQGADLLAYESRKSVSDMVKAEAVVASGGTPEFVIRESWRRLMDATMPNGQKRIWAQRWDADALTNCALPAGVS